MIEKFILRSVAILVVLMFQSLSARAETKKVNGKNLYIDGEFTEKNNDSKLKRVPVEDDELKFYKNELGNVKNLNKSFKMKKKTLEKLAQEAEQLKEQHLEYLENRLEWEEAIGAYNQQSSCADKDIQECYKFVKPKKKKRAAPAPRPRRRPKPVSHSNEDDLQDLMWQQSLNESTTVSTANFVSQLDQQIRGEAYRLESCYRNVNDDNFQGTIQTVLSITPNGKIDHIGIESADDGVHPRTLNCVSSVLYQLQLPAPGKKLKIRKPFYFRLRS